jgi:surfactin synthase thioesterase subunit
MSIKLLAIPFAGGNRYSLNYIRKYLPSDVEFLPLELPGRGLRLNEPLLDRIQDMADDLYMQIRDGGDGPYALFGYCMGALLAYLVARKAAAARESPPAHLFVCGCGAPAGLENSQLHLLEENEFRKILPAFITPVELLESEEFVGMISPVMRADLKGFSEYQHEAAAPLKTRITVILEKGDLLSFEKAGLWQDATSQPIRIGHLSGNLAGDPSGMADLLISSFRAAVPAARI